jgi:hypothetical protein
MIGGINRSMKSTIRFKEPYATKYQCKNLNFIQVNESSQVEVDGSNNVLGLAVRDNSRLELETSNDDEAFKLTIDKLSLESEYGLYTPKGVSGYLLFGYPHNYHGITFSIDATSTPKSLVVLKSANHSVAVSFDGSVVGMLAGVYGPLIQLMLADNSGGATDCKIILNDIVYESLS